MVREISLLIAFMAVCILVYLVRAEIGKVFKDSLTGDKGAYSSKKLSMAACLWTAIFMALYHLFNVGFDYQVFTALLLAGLGLSSLGIADKKLNDSVKEPVLNTETTNVNITKTETFPEQPGM